MRTPPLIGLSTSITTDRSPERAYVNTAYIRAIQGAGGAPVLLPPSLTAGSLEALWARLDGLVLSGGGDIDPARYGEARHPATSDVSAERDALEIELARRAVERGMPLLAICRGLQVLNVALGGSLVQDLPSQRPGPIVHSQTEAREVATHAVKVTADGSRLAAVLGSDEVRVNSFHHQAIRALGDGLREVAWAPDGVIEGVEMPGARLVLGVQWHPEDLVGHDSAARNLFAALVEAARTQPAVSP